MPVIRELLGERVSEHFLQSFRQSLHSAHGIAEAHRDAASLNGDGIHRKMPHWPIRGIDQGAGNQAAFRA